MERSKKNSVRLTNAHVLVGFWRHAALALLTVVSLLALFVVPPFGQEATYHAFADGRGFAGVSNFFNVISNLPFLLVGIAGLSLCARKTFHGATAAWIVFFAGITLVSFGSAHYHWRPCDETLIWDRLPLAVSCMALLAAMVSESLNDKFGRLLLAPAILIAVASIFCWARFDDLRLYAWVQFFPMVGILLMLALFASRYTRCALLPAALLCYAFAKVCELSDANVFALTRNIVSGHTMKHLFAAAGCLVILFMLQKRKSMPPANFSINSRTNRDGNVPA